VSGTWTARRTVTAEVSGDVGGSPLLFPHRRSGRHADRTQTMPPRLDAAVARGSSGSGPVSGRAPHQLPCPRWLPQEPPVSALVAGVREAAGHASEPEIAADTGLKRAGHQPRPDGGRSGSSGRSIRRSFRLVTISSTLPQGRPCGRQRHDGHQGTGLPSHQLQPKQSQAARADHVPVQVLLA
jgi:hypothetical protein